MQTNITTRTINSIKPKDKPYEIRDTGLKGLLLRVQPSGVLTYYIEFKRGKRVKIGRADAITPFQAREFGKAILSEVYQGEDPTDKRRLAQAQTYLQFLEDTYKQWLIANLRTGEKTFDRLKNSFTEFHLAKLHEINPWLVEKWRSRRQKDGMKPVSINRELADLRSMLGRAVQWGMLESHPLEKVKPCKVDSSPKVRFLSQDEETSLRTVLEVREKKLRAARERGNKWRAERGEPLYPSLEGVAFVDHLKPAILLSLNTGLRRGELFGLKWSDVDFNQKILTVTAETAKSGKTRHVPLNIEAFDILKQWKSQQGLKSEHVFIGKKGKPFHDIRSSWATILNKDNANIESFRWHDLRHTFASKLVMAGVDLNTVRELLGHTDYKMTLRYAHLAPEHKAMAVSKLIASGGSGP
jgi:integrase